MAKLKRRGLNLLIAIDQLLYVAITLGKRDHDETMSAAAWRLEKRGHLTCKIVRQIIDALFWFDPRQTTAPSPIRCSLRPSAARRRWINGWPQSRRSRPAILPKSLRVTASLEFYEPC